MEDEAIIKHYLSQHLIVEVLLSDPSYVKFSYILGQSPCDWKTTMRRNVVPTIFHTQHVCHHACETVRTSFQSINVLQLRGEGNEK